MHSAVRLHGAGDVRLDTAVPTPTPKPGEVLLEIGACGLCGSDVHYFTHWSRMDSGLAAMEERGQIIGHEFAATVTQLGEGVAEQWPELTVGTRVAVEPNRNCHCCESCDVGNPNMCDRLLFAGCGGPEGACQRYLAYPASRDLLFPLPACLSLEDGAMLEPMGIALHAVNLAHVKLADSVCVVGTGPIGLLIIALLKLSGATPIFAVERFAHRAQLAKHYGADHVLNCSLDEAVEQVRAKTGGRGCDLVFEAAGSTATPEACCRMVRKGGTVLIAGICAADVVQFRHSVARRSGLTVKFVRRMKHTYPRCIALAEKGLVDLRTMVSHRVPLDGVAGALQMLAKYQDEDVGFYHADAEAAVKVLVVPGAVGD